MDPKISGYLVSKAEIYSNAANDIFGTATVGLGGKIEKDGFYAKAEAGYGAGSYVGAEAGKYIPVGKNGFGLTASVSGQHTVSNATRDYYKTVFEEGANSPTWHPNDTRGSANLIFSYQNSSIEAGFGLRAGIRSSKQASLDGISLAPVGIIKGTEYAGRTTQNFAEGFTYFKKNFGKGWKGKAEAGFTKFMLGVEKEL